MPSIKTPTVRQHSIMKAKRSQLAYQPLGEVCVLKRGHSISNQAIAKQPGPFAVIGSGQQPRGFVSTYNTDDDPLGITWPSMFPTWRTGKYFRSSSNVSCTPKRPDLLLPRYLYHLLTELHCELRDITSRGGSTRSAWRGLAGLIIPIPELKVQQQIIANLDPFIELEAALEAELEAQTHRYLYLRRRLFDFQDNLTIKALGEICKLSAGDTLYIKNRYKHGKGQPGFFPVMSAARGVAGYTDRWNTEDAPLGITHSGSRVGRLTWCEGKYFRTSANWSCTVMDQTIASERYLFYLLNHMQPELTSLAYGTYAAIRLRHLSEFKVPIPPLRIQTEIVKTLDPYHALIHDQSQGLPGELAGRQQQLKFLRTAELRGFLHGRTDAPTVSWPTYSAASCRDTPEPGVALTLDPQEIAT